MGNDYETYELLKDSDMSFNDFVVDEKEYKLDNNLYGLYVESDNREIREKAFKGLYSTYKQFKNVFASLITSNIKEEVSLGLTLHKKSADEIENKLQDILEKCLEHIFRFLII